MTSYFLPTHTMSQICLLCGENEMQETTHHRICDACYDNAGDYLESNVHRIKAIPYLIEACKLAESEICELDELVGVNDDPQTQATIDALYEAVAMATRDPASDGDDTAN